MPASNFRTDAFGADDREESRSITPTAIAIKTLAEYLRFGVTDRVRSISSMPIGRRIKIDRFNLSYDLEAAGSLLRARRWFGSVVINGIEPNSPSALRQAENEPSQSN
jgi:hypothetical protein